MTSMEKREMIRHGKQIGMNTADMIKAYQVSRCTIYRLLALEKSFGSMNAHTNRCGRKPAITSTGLEQMKALILQEPDITLAEIKDAMGLSISLSAIHRIVHGKLGFTYKKRQYMQQNATPHG